MDKVLMFASADEVRFRKVLRFIIPTYLTSLFTTLYTMVDGIFVSSYVGTNALAAINIVYPIVNVLEGIALIFAVGGSAIATLYIGAREEQKANQSFSVSIIASLLIGCLVALLVGCNLTAILRFLGATEVTMADCKTYALWWLIGTPVVISRHLFAGFIRADGSPTYSFVAALAGGVGNIVLDYILIARFGMGILGAALATMIGLFISFGMGFFYFAKKASLLHVTLRGLTVSLGLRCMVNGTSECVEQLAIAITTVVFNRTAMSFAGEDGIAAVSVIMYLQFLVIGIYYGFSKGLATPLGYAYGDKRADVCRRLESYAYRFIGVSPVLLYGATYLLAPVGVGFFAERASAVYALAVSGMRWYGLGFLFSGMNIFCEIRLTAYGKGHLSGIVTALRSFGLLLLFLALLPNIFGLNGVWLAVPFAEGLTMIVSIVITVLADRKIRDEPMRLGKTAY